MEKIAIDARRIGPFLVAVLAGVAAASVLVGVLERGRPGGAAGDAAGAGAPVAAAPGPAAEPGAPAGVPAEGASEDPETAKATPAAPAAPVPLPAAPAPEAPDGPATAPPAPAPAPAPAAATAGHAARLPFREIWSYLMAGDRWSDDAPITDLCLFDFKLDDVGRLAGKANAAALRLAAARGIRTHLVVASAENRSLLHLVLCPRYGVRKALLAELAALPGRHGADGLQLDLEGPRPDERADLVSFVRELRAALPRRTRLSLAVPAKTEDKPAAFMYANLAQAADRLFVMVYDEHWKGGPAGPISDLAWHDRVLDCVRAHIPLETAVIGLPFYGQVWQKEKVAHAVTHEQAEALAARVGAQVCRDPAMTHSFSYRTEVTAQCWFEDAESVRTKLESARARGFANVGFWRLGQEDPRVWALLEKEAAGNGR